MPKHILPEPPADTQPADTQPADTQPAVSADARTLIAATSDLLPLDAFAYRVLADVLGGNGSVVAYRPYFAHAFGGACNAVLLSQFWFWTNTPTVKRREGEGWFYKSQKEITAETGLTRTETRTARRELCGLGILEEEVRGCPATLHYRLNKTGLFERLWAHIMLHPDGFAQNLQTAAGGDEALLKRGQNLQTGLPKTCKPARGKPANKIAEKPQAITETPQRKPKKTSETASPPEFLASLSSERKEPERKEPEQRGPDTAGGPGAAKAKGPRPMSRGWWQVQPDSPGVRAACERYKVEWRGPDAGGG